MKEITWQNVETKLLEEGLLASVHPNQKQYTSTINHPDGDISISLTMNHSWFVSHFSINQKELPLFSGTRESNHWVINGEALFFEEDITFIDISLTPFTNTLPINHMKQNQLTKTTFPILLFDVMKASFILCHQTYTLKKEKVLYENIDTNYFNVLTVDELGLVTDYPEAFFRIK